MQPTAYVKSLIPFSTATEFLTWYKTSLYRSEKDSTSNQAAKTSCKALADGKDS